MTSWRMAICSKHEHKSADMINGGVVKGSGAGPFAKGDVKNSSLLIECKASLKSLPKVPRPGIFMKICLEARNQNRIPMVSTAWVTGDSPDEVEIEDLRFFVPVKYVDKVPKSIKMLEVVCIPLSEVQFTKLSVWMEMDEPNFRKLLKEKKWKDSKNRYRRRTL